MAKKVYVAINKETGEILDGARGQHGFSSKSGLNKSMYQRYKYSKTVDDHRALYDVYELSAEIVKVTGRKVDN